MQPPKHLQVACEQISLVEGIQLPLESIGLEVPFSIPFTRNASPSQLQLGRS